MPLIRSAKPNGQDLFAYPKGILDQLSTHAARDLRRLREVRESSGLAHPASCSQSSGIPL